MLGWKGREKLSVMWQQHNPTPCCQPAWITDIYSGCSSDGPQRTFPEHLWPWSLHQLHCTQLLPTSLATPCCHLTLEDKIPGASQCAVMFSSLPASTLFKMWTPTRAQMNFCRTEDLLLELFICQTLFLLQFRDIVQKELKFVSLVNFIWRI